MPSNVVLNSGSGGSTATTKQLSHDGDTTQCQGVHLLGITGTEDAYTGTTVEAGGGVEANALRVTIANDSTGVVSVDDNGATLSVDDGAGSLTVDNAALSVTGGGTEASALRVTIANNSTGVLSVDDNGGALTVDNAGTFAVQADSVTPGTAAGNLGKAVDAVAGASDTGVAVLVVRDDSLSALTPADGDYTNLRVNSQGALHVTGGGGGTEYTVDVAAPAAPTGATFVMERDDALSALTEIEGDWTNPRSNANGALWTVIDGTVTVTGAGGTFPVTDSGGSLTVDNAALAVTGGGVEASALRVTIANDSTGLVSVDDNGGSLTVDNAALSVTGGGVEASALRVTIASDSTGVLSVDDNGGSLTIDGTVTANAGTGTFAVGGVAAHDAAVSGNPVLNAAEARTTNPTAVANGDVVRIMADDRGSLVVTNEAPRDLVTGNTRLALTSTTETTLVAAVASQFNDLTFLVLSNESATECRVDIRDATAGTVRISVDLAADGGGAVLPFPVPYPQTAANNNWTAQLSAAVSTVYITAVTVARN